MSCPHDHGQACPVPSIPRPLESPDPRTPKESNVRIGVPKEIKPDEYRVAMMPVGAEVLTKAGHQVFIEASAGVASGFPDEAYQKAGATILKSLEEVFAGSDMILK